MTARAKMDPVIDLPGAFDFLAAHGRLLDRLRLSLAVGDGPAEQVLSAVDAYANADGGFGWGLEPDLRDRSGQPAGALHAFEVFAEVAESSGLVTPRAIKLCDWLASNAGADGGLPFALPVTSPVASAPFWTGADHELSSLHITAAVTAEALRLARCDEHVAEHAWLAASTRYCLEAIDARKEPEHALELLYSLRFLDALSAAEPSRGAELSAHVERLGAAIPESGLLHVAGGRDDEFLRPLDLSPNPGTPSRRLFDPVVIEAELDRLRGRQQPDGGWPEEFASYSPQAALEWRGYLTVRAIMLLRAHGRA